MSAGDLVVEQGDGHVLLVFDVGLSIDLDLAARLVADPNRREGIRHTHRAPSSFQFDRLPLTVTQECAPLALGRWRSEPVVHLTLFDFGAVAVTFRLPFTGPLSGLAELSVQAVDSATLREEAGQRVQSLLSTISVAVEKPELSPLIEDYVVFHVTRHSAPWPVAELPERCAQDLARILRSETGPLSAQEVADALSARVSFAPDDLALIDWNVALVLDEEANDTLAVLEFANVQLLELRFLDRRLDAALDESYALLTGPLRFLFSPVDFRRVGQLQVDGGILHERVTNALKLLGDQFLARIYRQAAQRLRLAEWSQAITQKLGTLDSIYQKMEDRASARRMEVLEWIIIVLFLVSIVMPML